MASVVRAVVCWQYTGEVIQDRNHLNVLFVANDSQHQVALLDTAEFIQVNTSAQNVADVVRAVVIWQYTSEVIQERSSIAVHNVGRVFHLHKV